MKNHLLSITSTVLLILSLLGNVFLLFNSSQQTQQYQLLADQYRQERDREKRDKDEIYKLGETQAGTNDILITNQQDVLLYLRDYLDEINRSFRFVNTQPQFLPSISEDNLRTAETQLQDRVSQLEKAITENTKKKQQFIDQTNSIYKEAGQDKPNRANPRDGVR